MSDNQLVWEANNSAFGRISATAYSGAMYKGIPLGFPGQYLDETSGLWYNWHRYYNQEWGRYLQSDPIGLDGGINTYGYAYQNPLPSAALNLATGVTGGVVAGPIARIGLPFNTSSRFFDPGYARQLNNEAAIAANTKKSSLLRSVGAGVVSNTDPTGGGCGCP